MPGKGPDDVGLPIRPFLYTLDQVGDLFGATPQWVKSNVFYSGRTPGACPLNKMMARNIAHIGDKPDWRVAERELVRWMRRRGFKVYERGWVLK